MNVAVKGIMQTFSFDDGETRNYLQLVLPSGELIAAYIDEKSAQELTTAFIQSEGGQVPAAPARPPLEVFNNPNTLASRDFSPLSVDGDDGTVVFGGEAAPMESVSSNRHEDVQAPSWVNARAPEIAPPLIAPAPARNERAPIVEADSLGYPVLRGGGRVDTSKLMGGDGANEEDGIGQA